MHKIQHIIDHIERAYKLELVGTAYLRMGRRLKDDEVWFYKRNSEGRILIEIVIRSVPIEACIYLACDSGFFKPMGENYIVKIYGQHNSIDHISFPLNHHNGIEQVDYYFSKESELKRELRNYKLNILINV